MAVESFVVVVESFVVVIESFVFVETEAIST